MSNKKFRIILAVAAGLILLGVGGWLISDLLINNETNTFTEDDLQTAKAEAERFILNNAKYRELGGQDLELVSIGSDYGELECNDCEVLSYEFNSEDGQLFSIQIDVTKISRNVISIDHATMQNEEDLNKYYDMVAEKEITVFEPISDSEVKDMIVILSLGDQSYSYNSEYPIPFSFRLFERYSMDVVLNDYDAVSFELTDPSLEKSANIFIINSGRKDLGGMDENMSIDEYLISNYTATTCVSADTFEQTTIGGRTVTKGSGSGDCGELGEVTIEGYAFNTENYTWDYIVITGDPDTAKDIIRSLEL